MLITWIHTELKLIEKSDALQLLRVALGDNSAEFRSGQWEAIDAIVNRSERRLVVERTGWGKSTVYFIAAKFLRQAGKGPTLIISPLLALMRNQIETAAKYGVRAQSINSTNTGDFNAIRTAVLNGEIDVLLISPEQLAKEKFVTEVLMPISHNLGLFVVDEAHCISDWGHDFRPNYRRIVNILKNMPSNMPILGTTATANNRVIEDIRTQLGNITVQRGSLTRKSLNLQTVKLPSRAARLAWLSQNINSMPGTGIIYVLTKRDAEQVTNWLCKNGVDAHPYYNGVTKDGFVDSNNYRQHLEDLLLRSKIKVLVATAALGMGYDKPDLSFVIHYQAPGSILTYYQQVGRAGRNIPTAYGVLLSGEEDHKIHEYFRRSAFPKLEWVRKIIGLLGENDGASMNEIQAKLNLRYKQIKQVLEFLSVENPSPVIRIGTIWKRTPVEYSMDVDKIERLTTQRLSEWEEVREYIGHKDCLMQFLATSLDDENPEMCGKCSSCLGQPVISNVINQGVAQKAVDFLNHSEMPLKCKIQIPKNALPEYGFSGRLPSHLRAQQGKILSVWGEAGWGEIVRRDKRAGCFSDELVAALVAMIKERWQPNPSPTWVTCAPSMNNPNLVPKMAKMVADQLGLPFYDVVKKIKNTPSQKNQENSFHQCQNLDGVFVIEGMSHKGPVLLIDDVFDSGWTMTIISALLLNQGCQDVFPVALASASVG